MAATGSGQRGGAGLERAPRLHQRVRPLYGLRRGGGFIRAGLAPAPLGPLERSGEGAEARLHASAPGANGGLESCEEARAEEKRAKAEKKAAKAEEKAARKALEESRKTEEAVREKANATASDLDGRLRFESPMHRDEVASYLEAIVKGLHKGSIQFRQGESVLTVSPADRVEIGVRVSRKDGTEQLSFEVEWSTEEPTELTIVPG